MWPIMSRRALPTRQAQLITPATAHPAARKRCKPVVGALRRVDGLSELADGYQGLLLDQYGVLHDGHTPYPGAMEAVWRAAAAGLAIVIVSNSSRRCGGTLSKLAAMGFEEAWFAGAITSGEMTHRALAERPGPAWQSLGRRCLHITWGARGAITLAGEGLSEAGYEPVTEPGDADILLVHGTEALALPGGGVQPASLEQLGELVAACAARRPPPPLVCANPDLVTVDGGDRLVTMPGTLAAQYAQLAGEVRLMGKPAPGIYGAARALVPQVQRWLAVGDSLEHDIAGAQGAGVDTLFIVGGIHKQEAGLVGGPEQGNPGASWDARALGGLCAQHGVAAPTAAMAFMAW